MKRICSTFVALLLAVVSADAQIGYQLTVFDPAKKTPKANQSVSATVTITDSSGSTLCTETVSGTTDDFGILSMQIGNASTFSNVDWSKLPLWISATVDGITISKTQILNVPVAEYAKATGQLTHAILSSKVWKTERYTLIFKNGNVTVTSLRPDDDPPRVMKYYITGNIAVAITSQSGYAMAFVYVPEKNVLYCDESIYH